jgi:dTDP-4-amino-4,6-dideoxygalactose transaminase
MTERVPFTDIYIDDETIDRTTEVLESTQYVKGDRLEKFETEFAEECGTKHAVGVHSGTAAILCGLKAAGIGEGDEVFVPGHTFFATVSPVLSLDAEPVFVDIDPKTYTMDPGDLERKVEEATDPQGIVPVHIYGQMADMEQIQEIANAHDLAVVEDSCQAHFAERNGHVAGTVGDVGAFSFYPSKNMTVGGDGGMLVTDDDQIARDARALRNHGRTEDGTHEVLGLNYRLGEFKAAVGRRQLELIRDWNGARNAAAKKYDERLSSIPEVTTPAEASDSFHVYHLYVVQVPDRDGFREHLEENGIDTGIHYETPAHRHPVVLERTDRVELERTERLCDRIVSLPMHPRITDDEIERVCVEIEEYYR